MFAIRNYKCTNGDCSVESFSAAEIEPPICPACHVCSRCGHDEEEHADRCPNECVECGELVENEDERNNDPFSGELYCDSCFAAHKVNNGTATGVNYD